MKAACYVGDRTVDVVECASRPPGPGEVQLEVSYAGICGTDLHIVHGAMDARVAIPAVLGHEMSGVVATIGDGVEEWNAGDRVTVMPLLWCGDCPACRAGNNHVCHRLTFIGIDAPGAMQGRWNVPEGVLVAIPDGLSLRVAALAEPTAVAVHDVRRARLAAGERTLVVGGGPIGILVALVARARGAEVVLLEPMALRRELAASLGLLCLDPGSDDIPARIDAWTAGAGVSVAFEVSGAVAGLDAALQSLAVRGRLVVVAIHAVAPPVDLFRVFWRELTLVGARVYERPDFEEAVRLLAAGDVPAEPLITSVEPLARAAAAFDTLEAGRATKILIDCRS